MRIWIALLIILLFLTGSILPEKSTDAIHELQRLHDSITHQSEGNKWKVTIKEQIDPTNVETLVTNDESRHLVASSSTENKVQYEMEYKNIKETDINFHLNHYIDEDLAEVLIEISGNNWNELIANEYDNFITYIKDLYISDKALVFACLSSTYSGTMSRSKLEKEMIDILGLQHVAKVTDSLINPQKQLVLSGYSPYIEDAITIGNEEINIQIVIKTNDSEQFSVMIGTPIIIDEY